MALPIAGATVTMVVCDIPLEPNGPGPSPASMTDVCIELGRSFSNRQAILKGIAVQDLAIGVNHLLEQGMTESHHGAAEQLRDRRFIMKHLAGIDRHRILQDFKLPGVRIDFYFGDGRAGRPMVHAGKRR